MKQEKKVRKEGSDSFLSLLKDYGVSSEELSGVSYSSEKESGAGYWTKQLLPFLFPILFLILIFYFFFRTTKGVGSQAFSFGKSKAQVH